MKICFVIIAVMIGVIFYQQKEIISLRGLVALTYAESNFHKTHAKMLEEYLSKGATHES